MGLEIGLEPFSIREREDAGTPIFLAKALRE